MLNNQDEKNDFESIYTQYYARIYAFVLKRVRDVHETEDLVNEVFYACFKNLGKYDESKASMLSWLYAITNNRLKNFYRGKKDTLSVNDENRPVDLPFEEDFDSAVYLTEMRRTLYAALKILSQREQRIVLLKYYQELSSEQIALKLGLAAGNIRVILSRAIHKLNQYFKENNIDWEF